MRCTVLIAMILSGAIVPGAFAQNYSMIDLGLLPGNNSGGAAAINDNGLIAGNSAQLTTDNNVVTDQAVVWSAGEPASPQELGDVSNSTGTNSITLSDTNEIMGYASGSSYLYDTGVIFNLSNSSNNYRLAVDAVPLALNDHGTIVGEDSAGFAAIIDSTGGNNQIGLGTIPGKAGAAALTINDSGEVVGIAGNPGIGVRSPSQAYDQVVITGEAPNAVLFDNTGSGNNINLGTLGGLYSGAIGVSNAGQIIGYAYNAAGYQRATLFDSTGAGHNIDLGTLGGNTSVATAISRNGMIVGMADDQFGFSQPTIFDPTGNQANINLALCLPAAAGFVQQVLGVNNSGLIVGNAYTQKGSEQPVLLNSNSAPGPVGISFSYTATAQANTNSVSTTNAIAGTSYEEQWQETHTGQILNDSLNETTDVIAYNHNGSSLDIISEMIESEGAYNDFRTGNTETTVQAVIQIGTTESIPLGTPLEAELSALLESNFLSSYVVSVTRDGITIADLSSSNQSTYFTVYAGEQLELQNNFITNAEAPGYDNFLGITFTIVPEPAIAGLLFPFLIWLPRRKRR